MRKRAMREVWTVLIGLVYALVAGVAIASGDSAPQDLSDLKTLSADRASSPIGCIGQGGVPLCAVETAVACDVWSDQSLCRAVGYEPPFELWSHEDYWRLYVFRYKAVAEHTLTRADIPEWAGGLGAASWRPGDVAYDVWFQVCRPSNTCMLATSGDPRTSGASGCIADRCEWETGPRTYILRQARNGWRVVYVYIPQWHERDHWLPTWKTNGDGG